jgi:membrane-associated phospholipid phosphatase
MTKDSRERSTQAFTIPDATMRAIHFAQAPRYRAARRGAAVLTLAASLVATQPGAAGAPHGNAVIHWNTVAEEVFAPTQGTNPLAQSRTLAIMHAAIHDALNAIDRRFESYTPGLASAPGASPPVAVAAAARDVLIALVPGGAAMVNAAYERALTSVADKKSKAAGVAVGRAAASLTLTRRQGDGLDSATQPVYVPRPGPGEYQFTPPFAFANLPGWGRVQPFVIDVQEHGVDGPHRLSSLEYARDLEHVKVIGGIRSLTRTPDQAEIAQFWYEDSPLGWNRITNTVARQRQPDLWMAARAFALVNFALADGFVAGFDAKYRFRFWRPVTAIQQAETDGNPVTEADPAWQPFLITPPVPDYPSTHTVLGAAAAEVLIRLYGDNVGFGATSLTLPGVTRHFKGFSAAARENGLSRVYAGIHFQHAVTDGYRQGQSIGRAVAALLRPVG